MSTSDLYRVYKTTATGFAEFRNGHGTAPLVWDYLCEKFLGKPRSTWLFGGSDVEALWALCRDDRVPRAVRVVHSFIFDNAICPLPRLAELADACDETARICCTDGHVNHWQSIATVLRAHKGKPRQLGVAISCTSVNDVWSAWKGEPAPWSLFDALLAEKAKDSAP